MTARVLGGLLGLGFFVCSLSACGSDDGEGATVSAADALVSCQQRDAWTQAATQACQSCQISTYVDSTCACIEPQYAGKCQAVLQARTNEADCVAAVDQCVSLCQSTDCDCVDACYVGHEKCQQREATYQRCVTDTCHDACQ